MRKRGHTACPFSNFQNVLRKGVNLVMLHLPVPLFPSLCPPSVCLCLSFSLTLCSLRVSVWKLGTPNYRGLSVIMYLAAEMYWRSVPPWKKRTPSINWGILPLRSISMFLTVIFIPSDLNKYLCLAEKKENKKMREWGKNQYEKYVIISGRYRNNWFCYV